MSTAILGAVLLGAVSLWWGLEKSREEEKRLHILMGLAAFCRYVGEEIKAYRTPLFKIFSDFENDALSEAGFISLLRNEGITAAVSSLEGITDREVQRELLHFAGELGGGDTESQQTLCTLTLERLERALEEFRLSYTERKRMYKLLPLLLGASVIILLL